jgi:hypothetical protein
MRKIRIIFFLIIGMRCFCSSGQVNNPIQILGDSTRITSLPFGVSLLTTYHFPGDIINFFVPAGSLARGLCGVMNTHPVKK